MKLKVNLIPKGAVKISKVNRTIKQLKIAAYVVVGIMVAAVVAALVVRGGLEAKLSSVKAQIVAVDEQLLELKEKELELSYNSLILANAVKIVSQRRDFRQIINDVYSMAGSGSWVDNLTFDEDSVMVAFKSEGVGAFRAMEASLQGRAENKFEWLETIDVTTISRSGKAIYTINADMKLIKTDQKKGAK